MRKISDKGLALIKEFEGYRSKAYKCAAGVWTIGWGTTKVNGRSVTSGMTCTQAQALEWLKSDCEKFEANVNKYNAKYNWNQNEFDAMVSFAYNLGSINGLTAYGTRSKTLIATKMLQYCKANGKRLDGLYKRRVKERDLFLSAVEETVAPETTTATSAHVPLNYQVGNDYKVVATSLKVRTKKASEPISKIPNGTQIGSKKSGQTVTCYASALVNGQIWMFIGADTKGREQWVCADNGTKAYVI